MYDAVEKKILTNREDEIKGEMSGECQYGGVTVSDISSYINNEGQIGMYEGKCDRHLDACKDFDLSKQICNCQRQNIGRENGGEYEN